MSDELGSLIKETTAPSTIGKLEGSLVLKSKNKEWQQIVADSKTETYYHERNNKMKALKHK